MATIRYKGLEGNKWEVSPNGIKLAPDSGSVFNYIGIVGYDNGIVSTPLSAGKIYKTSVEVESTNSPYNLSFRGRSPFPDVEFLEREYTGSVIVHSYIQPLYTADSDIILEIGANLSSFGANLLKDVELTEISFYINGYRPYSEITNPMDYKSSAQPNGWIFLEDTNEYYYKQDPNITEDKVYSSYSSVSGGDKDYIAYRIEYDVINIKIGEIIVDSGNCKVWIASHRDVSRLGETGSSAVLLHEEGITTAGSYTTQGLRGINDNGDRNYIVIEFVNNGEGSVKGIEIEGSYHDSNNSTVVMTSNQNGRSFTIPSNGANFEFPYYERRPLGPNDDIEPMILSSRVGNSYIKSMIWRDGVWNNGWRKDDTLREFTDIDFSILTMSDKSWRVRLVGDYKSIRGLNAGDVISIGNIVAININNERKLLKDYYTIEEITDIPGDINKYIVVNLNTNFPYMRIERDSKNHNIKVTKNIWLSGAFLNGYFTGVWNNGLFKGYPLITEMEDTHWIDGYFDGGRFESTYKEVGIYSLSPRGGCHAGYTQVSVDLSDGETFIIGEYVFVELSDVDAIFPTPGEARDAFISLKADIERASYRIMDIEVSDTDPTKYLISINYIIKNSIPVMISSIGSIKSYSYTSLIQNFNFKDNNKSGSTSIDNTSSTAVFSFESWLDVNYDPSRAVTIGSNYRLPEKMSGKTVAKNNFYGYPTYDVLSSNSSFRDSDTLKSKLYRLGTKYRVYSDFIGEASEFNEPFGAIVGWDKYHEQGWDHKMLNDENITNGNYKVERSDILINSGSQQSIQYINEGVSGNELYVETNEYGITENNNNISIANNRYSVVEFDLTTAKYSSPIYIHENADVMETFNRQLITGRYFEPELFNPEPLYENAGVFQKNGSVGVSILQNSNLGRFSREVLCMILEGGSLYALTNGASSYNGSGSSYIWKINTSSFSGEAISTEPLDSGENHIKLAFGGGQLLLLTNKKVWKMPIGGGGWASIVNTSSSEFDFNSFTDFLYISDYIILVGDFSYEHVLSGVDVSGILTIDVDGDIQITDIITTNTKIISANRNLNIDVEEDTNFLTITNNGNPFNFNGLSNISFVYFDPTNISNGIKSSVDFSNINNVYDVDLKNNNFFIGGSFQTFPRALAGYQNFDATPLVLMNLLPGFSASPPTTIRKIHRIDNFVLATGDNLNGTFGTAQDQISNNMLLLEVSGSSVVPRTITTLGSAPKINGVIELGGQYILYGDFVYSDDSGYIAKMEFDLSDLPQSEINLINELSLSISNFSVAEGVGMGQIVMNFGIEETSNNYRMVNIKENKVGLSPSSFINTTVGLLPGNTSALLSSGSGIVSGDRRIDNKPSSIANSDSILLNNNIFFTSQDNNYYLDTVAKKWVLHIISNSPIQNFISNLDVKLNINLSVYDSTFINQEPTATTPILHLGNLNYEITNQMSGSDEVVIYKKMSYLPISDNINHLLVKNSYRLDSQEEMIPSKYNNSDIVNPTKKYEYFYNKTDLMMTMRGSGLGGIFKNGFVLDNIKFYEVDMIPFFKYYDEINIDRGIKIPNNGNSLNIKDMNNDFIIIDNDGVNTGIVFDGLDYEDKCSVVTLEPDAYRASMWFNDGSQGTNIDITNDDEMDIIVEITSEVEYLIVDDTDAFYDYGKYTLKYRKDGGTLTDHPDYTNTIIPTTPKIPIGSITLTGIDYDDDSTYEFFVEFTTKNGKIINTNSIVITTSDVEIIVGDFVQIQFGTGFPANGGTSITLESTVEFFSFGIASPIPTWINTNTLSWQLALNGNLSSPTFTPITTIDATNPTNLSSVFYNVPYNSVYPTNLIRLAGIDTNGVQRYSNVISITREQSGVAQFILLNTPAPMPRYTGTPPGLYHEVWIRTQGVPALVDTVQFNYSFMGNNGIINASVTSTNYIDIDSNVRQYTVSLKLLGHYYGNITITASYGTLGNLTNSVNSVTLPPPLSPYYEEPLLPFP